MNVVIEFICHHHTDPSLSTPPVKAFMDDLFFLSSSESKFQCLFEWCATALSWCSMSFRAHKSRSIIICSGKIVHKASFSVSFVGSEKVFIPSIHSNPVKFPGRRIDRSLSDKSAIDLFTETFFKGLLLIHKSCHKGLHKVWILYHLLIPRVRWPLQIYEVPLSTVIKMEQKMSFYIRSWLKLHPSLSNLALYPKVSPCPLPFKSLVSVFKSAKVSGHLLLRDLEDQCTLSVKKKSAKSD